MTFKQEHIMVEVAACLSVIHDGEGARDLSIFCQEGEDSIFLQKIEEIHAFAGGEQQAVVERMRFLASGEEFTNLADIHPAWLVEALSKESPRIIGIILRYLPSAQVRYIIEHLPRRIKQNLPQLIDSFAVPAPILKIIRKRFERRFISSAIPRGTGEFRFENIACLGGRSLQVLFKDIGLHELAMALKGIDRRSLSIIFNRLSVEEARGLQQRIRSIVDVHPALLREAKYTVLEVSLSEATPDDLLFEIGLIAFAKSLSIDDAAIFSMIRQKIEPSRSYSLRRYIDQHAPSNFADIVAMRKEIILRRVEILSKSGEINEAAVGGLLFPPPLPSATEEAAGLLYNPKSSPYNWHEKDSVI